MEGAAKVVIRALTAGVSITGTSRMMEASAAVGNAALSVLATAAPPCTTNSSVTSVPSTFRLTSCDATPAAEATALLSVV
jgi:hypothetical protein